MMQEIAPAEQEPALNVLLCKMNLPARGARYLRGAGFALDEMNTTSKALRALDGQRYSHVVVDLSSGGNGADRVAEKLLGMENPPELVCACSRRTKRAIERARAFGVETAYTWPQGVISHIIDSLPSTLGLKMRAAERLVLEQTFGTSSSSNLGGQLVNISATGALMDFVGPVDSELFSLEFTLPTDESPIRVVAELVRSQPMGKRTRVAVRFVRIAPVAQRKLQAFVRSYNAIEVSEDTNDLPPQIPRAKISIEGEKRTDYYNLVCHSGPKVTIWPRGEFVPPLKPGAVVHISFQRPRDLTGYLVGRVIEPDLASGFSPQAWKVEVTRTEQAKIGVIEQIRTVIAYQAGAQPQPRANPRRRPPSDRPEQGDS